MYPTTTDGTVHVPEWPKKPAAPAVLPGTKRYVVLDKDGALVFESDDAGEAIGYMGAGGGVSMCDRNLKPRVNTFTGTFTELPPKE